MADMFDGLFQEYDIITMQEVLGMATGELKELFITLGQKAGFIYQASIDPCVPMFHNANLCDSGLMILSRLPIVE